MTPYEMAAQLAQKAGPDQCKSWRVGFRDGLLGVPHSSLFGGKAQVAQITAYARGCAEAQRLSDEDEADGGGSDLAMGPMDGMTVAEAFACIDRWSESIRLRITISQHDRAIRSYHDHVRNADLHTAEGKLAFEGLSVGSFDPEHPSYDGGPA